MPRGGPGGIRAPYNHRPKTCEACGEEYTPTSSQQLKCGACRALYHGMPDHVWRHLARLKNGGLEWNCERCGKDLKKFILARADQQTWETHHKDGNHSNDDPGNIELLCFRCHKKHHGPETHTAESIAKQSETMRKRWAEGRYSSEEIKNKQSWLGRKHSPETLAKMSRSRKLYWQSKQINKG